MMELYSPERHRRFATTGPAIKIREKAVVLNKVALEYIYAPTRLNVWFDNETNVIALKEDKENGAIKVELANKGSSGRMGSKLFLQWLLEEKGIKQGTYMGGYDEETKLLTFKVEV